jgi:hypothetical protein
VQVEPFLAVTPITALTEAIAYSAQLQALAVEQVIQLALTDLLVVRAVVVVVLRLLVALGRLYKVQMVVTVQTFPARTLVVVVVEPVRSVVMARGQSVARAVTG